MRWLPALLLWLSVLPLAAEPAPVRVNRAQRVARLLERGALHESQGDTVSALAYYRDAISAAPRESAGYVALGSLYLTLAEPMRALEVFETGARNARVDARLWLGLARALEASGQSARALDVLRQLRAEEVDASEGLSALADALEQRGAFIEAVAARRALLARLGTSDPAQLSEQRLRVRALEHLLGSAEHVRAPQRCREPSASSLQRALSRCP